MEQLLHDIGDIIEYEGIDLQVTGMSDASPGTCGEPEVLYECITRHGEVKMVLDWELASYLLSKITEGVE